ncbi:MAG: hypothetical protein M1462_03615 [Candidatus Thermoplasmatota archaeon]|jgi:hypothetical protein|uniref:hypothetical protein n=1 Tax=Ferroplasma sp. TaxID=2591003 RepID=UPI002631B49C|nr:hypothetical protein [Ferroplasma sp.]MCL4311499.1 hypothetical protein [Candidatus Thermoplasmatota archaeon]
MPTKDKEIKIENDDEFKEFMLSQGLGDHSKVPVERVMFSRRVKAAFWFLRIYIIIMILMVIIGFAHVV